MFDLIPEFTIDYEMFMNQTASRNKIGFCLSGPKLKSQFLWTTFLHCTSSSKPWHITS